MVEAKLEALINLLIETQWNHHHYQEEHLQGQYNLNWASWYADYLLAHGLPDLLGRPVEAEDLAALLARLDEEHHRTRPNQEWPEFYARKLLAGDLP